jgi:diaminopropionate ammonia-lyase
MNRPATIAETVRLHVNVRAARSESAATFDDILPPAAFAAALREIAAWPSYRPTPLLRLPALARETGLRDLWLKNEGERFGLGSFKALGGSYAVFRLLAATVAARTGAAPGAGELAGGRHRALTGDITVATATDGNHGRSVAWGARTFGCRAVIYIHETVSKAREAAIAGLGAEVRRMPGTYDDSVRSLAADAATHGWHVISDTAYDGYTEVPRQVMAAYGTIGAEIASQLPPGTRPTHLFVQAGCGALASSLYAYLRRHWREACPRLVVVEPMAADCCYRSAAAGRPTRVPGQLRTVMAGLACGEVSILAWPILERGASAFLAVADEAAVDAMRRLAAGTDGDPSVVAGEAGIGGIAGLLAAARVPDIRRALGLDEQASVLTIVSEGDTDPDLYARLVGRPAAGVRAG